MSYRMPEYWHNANDAAPHTRISVDNGTVCRISLPCFYWYKDEYQPNHDRDAHDHAGWPSPDHPDDSCQPGHYHDSSWVMRPINLIEEGYTSIQVGFDQKYEDDIHISGTIDDSVIDVVIQCDCELATDHDIDVPFSIYAVNDDESLSGMLRDVVLKGVLHIVAGNLSNPESV